MRVMKLDYDCNILESNGIKTMLDYLRCSQM